MVCLLLVWEGRSRSSRIRCRMMSPGDLDRRGNRGVGLGLVLMLRRLCVTLVGPRFTLWQLGQGHDWGGEGEALIFSHKGGVWWCWWWWCMQARDARHCHRGGLGLPAAAAIGQVGGRSVACMLDMRWNILRNMKDDASFERAGRRRTGRSMRSAGRRQRKKSLS